LAQFRAPRQRPIVQILAVLGSAHQASGAGRGETIAPFRLLEPVTAVIPLDGATLLDAEAASAATYRHLAAWLRYTEAQWKEHSNKDANGNARMTLLDRVDHMRNLSIQAGPPTIRVLYTKAGTRLSAVRISTDDLISTTRPIGRRRERRGKRLI
jgi:hypothetical protein